MKTGFKFGAYTRLLAALWLAASGLLSWGPVRIEAAEAESPVVAVVALEMKTNGQIVAGQEVRVLIRGDGMKDLYGFELRLAYDAAKLQFGSFKSLRPGLTVPPQSDAGAGQLLVAHTKVGRSTRGDDGAVELAELVFQAKAAGEAAIELQGAKLVSSGVVTTEPLLPVRLEVRIAAAGESGAAAFADMDGHWAQKQAERAAALGIVEGYPDGTFRPQQPVTRAEFATMLNRIAGWSAAGDEPAFADRSDIPEWASPHVAAAAAAGIVEGYEDGTFRPDRSITRAELTTMIMRMPEAASWLPDGEAGGEAERQTGGSRAGAFADADEIPLWAQPAVAAAVSAGLVQGREQNRFVPADNATRAEAVTLLLAVYDRLE